MSVFKNGKYYHYEFKLDGRRRRGSTGTANKQQAIAEERKQRERLEKSYSQVLEEEAREQQRKTIKEAADDFLVDHRLKHASATFAEYALGHVTDRLGKKLVVEITPAVVRRYQADRLAAKAGPKTINDEVLLLLRLCGDQGELIRAKMRREKSLKLKTPPSPGRAYTADEKARMLTEAKKLRSKNMYPALVLDLNCGLRDKELRELRWQQIDLLDKKTLTVGKSKTDAGTGRVIPLNETVLAALRRTQRGTSSALASASWSGTCSPPAKGSRMIPRVQSARSRLRGPRCATRRM
jgi:integrase